MCNAARRHEISNRPRLAITDAHNGFMLESCQRYVLKNVSAALDSIAKDLERGHKSREYLIRKSRDVIILCSKAIIAVHGGDLKQAKASAARAQKLLKAHQARAGVDLARYLAVPEQELVEALCMIAFAEETPAPSRKEIGVSGEAYVLGLLDCIGELKRMAYDAIRSGKTEHAEKVFATMESLYNMLYPFATYDKLLRDARRKLDTNRVLLESVRSALTEEVRRAELIRAMGE